MTCFNLGQGLGFTPYLVDVLEERSFAKPLPDDFDVWVRRAQNQLALEQHFPAGTRLGTFNDAPVLRLDKILRGEKIRTPQYFDRIKPELEERTGLDSEQEDLLDLCGYNVSQYVEDLRELHKTDPVTVQLLLAKEFKYCPAVKNVQGAENEFKSATQVLAKDALLRAGTSLAEHERLIGPSFIRWADIPFSYALLTIRFYQDDEIGSAKER